MSEPRKYNIGPLPDQDADVSRFEESEILWGRVVGVAFLGVLCLVFVLSWVLGAFETQDTGASQTSSISLKPQVLSDQQVSDKDVPDKQMPDQESTENSAQALDASVTETSEMATSVVTASTVSGSVATNQPEVAESKVAESVAEQDKVLDSPLISTVTTLHEGVQETELVIGLADGSHSQPLGYTVPMSDEGIIKVILKTRMINLKGTVLYHDWYRQDQRMARVKIPVNINDQASYSSKFVNQQMLGEWTVKVRDSADELYAQANFKVE